MRRGVGILALVVVTAVVLLLVAKAWQKHAARAIELTRPAPVQVAPSLESAPGQVLPGLEEMKRGVDAHADTLHETLQQAEGD